MNRPYGSVENLRSSVLHGQSPEEDFRTTDVYDALCERVRLEEGDSNFLLCSPLDHYQQVGDKASSDSGKGWACGYRNIQILASALMKYPPYRKVLFGGCGFVPKIKALQAWLEVAWRAGFDRGGGLELGMQVVGTHKWIGAADCVALLRYFGINAQLFHFDASNRGRRGAAPPSHGRPPQHPAAAPQGEAPPYPYPSYPPPYVQSPSMSLPEGMGYSPYPGHAGDMYSPYYSPAVPPAGASEPFVNATAEAQPYDPSMEYGRYPAPFHAHSSRYSGPYYYGGDPSRVRGFGDKQDAGHGSDKCSDSDDTVHSADSASASRGSSSKGSGGQSTSADHTTSSVSSTHNSGPSISSSSSRSRRSPYEQHLVCELDGLEEIVPAALESSNWWDDGYASSMSTKEVAVEGIAAVEWQRRYQSAKQRPSKVSVSKRLGRAGLGDSHSTASTLAEASADILSKAMHRVLDTPSGSLHDDEYDDDDSVDDPDQDDDMAEDGVECQGAEGDEPMEGTEGNDNGAGASGQRKKIALHSSDQPSHASKGISRGGRGRSPSGGRRKSAASDNDGHTSSSDDDTRQRGGSGRSRRRRRPPSMGSHTALLEWVRQYFADPDRAVRRVLKDLRLHPREDGGVQHDGHDKGGGGIRDVRPRRPHRRHSADTVAETPQDSRSDVHGSDTTSRTSSTSPVLRGKGGSDVDAKGQQSDGSNSGGGEGPGSTSGDTPVPYEHHVDEYIRWVEQRKDELNDPNPKADDRLKWPFPLFLQHDGHSRTVVGVEEKGGAGGGSAAEQRPAPTSVTQPAEATGDGENDEEPRGGSTVERKDDGSSHSHSHSQSNDSDAQPAKRQRVERKPQRRAAKRSLNLLVLDPMTDGHRLASHLIRGTSWKRLLKRGPHTFQKPQYQVVVVMRGSLLTGQEYVDAQTIHPIYISL